MLCPKCHKPMESVAIGDNDVHRCTGCLGLWFDAAALFHLKQLKGTEVLDIGPAALGRQHNKIDRIHCPACNNPMIRMVDVEQPHIHFESCIVCYGAFLDAGEFRDLKELTLADYFRDLFTRERK